MADAEEAQRTMEELSAGGPRSRRDGPARVMVSRRPSRSGTARAIAAALLALAQPVAAEVVEGRHHSRAFRLHVPRLAGDARPALVVALHGCGQTPEDFARGTRLDGAAEPRGALVLYPKQPLARHPARCWNWFAPGPPRGGEAGELLDLVRHVADQRRVAPDRVIVVGFSAGGFMAVNLVCAAPELFAGVAVAAGGPYRCGTGVAGAAACMRGHGRDGEAAAAACRAAMGPAARAVRASLWHGDADRIVDPANLDALAEMFRRLGDVTRPPSETRDGAVHAVHGGPGGATLLETWLVRGMGHAWSGGDPRGSRTHPPGPDATARILDFLLE
jgi:poly(hydroxyalkanoate) depolymerase family esterase